MSPTEKARRLRERLTIDPDETPSPTSRAPASGPAATATAPTASVAHSPRNPRDDYDDIDELADSIRQVGVLQPLGVVSAEVFLTHYPEHEPTLAGRVWVAVHGNRRLAAVRKVGLLDVPIHVLDALGGDEPQLDEAALIENIHREALPPLREAAALEILVARHGSQRKAASRIGKSQGFISQRIGLLRLPDPLKQALTDRSLTVEAARAIAALPAEEQQAIADAGPPYTLPESGRAPRKKRQSGETSAPVMVIRVAANAPDQLAAALRDKLSPEELTELVRRLTAE